MIIVNSDYAGDNNDGVIQQRIGTTAEWNDAISKGIYPAKGEIIVEIATEQNPQDNSTIQVYKSRLGIDKEEITKVEDLPLMATEGSNGVGEQTLDGGEIFNSYIDETGSFGAKRNMAIGKGSHAEGIDTVAGLKGFKVLEFTSNNDTNKITITCQANADMIAKIQKIKSGEDETSFYNKSFGLSNGFIEFNNLILSSSDYINVSTSNNTFTIITDTIAELDINDKTFVLYFMDILTLGIDTVFSCGHAEGISTRALGSGSHSEGVDTKAIGPYTHAEGDNTQAIGVGTHAAGHNTIANGEYSHAGGEGTIANGNSQTVIGQYNDPNTEDLFIIGNGESENERSNILSVSKDSVEVYKDLNVEQNIITPILQVKNIKSNNEEDIVFSSVINAEQGIQAKEESEFNKIEVKDLEVTGEFILSGESTGDLITSDNFKGEAKLSDILNQENPKIGDRWVISEIDETSAFNTQVTFTDSIFNNSKWLSGYIENNSVINQNKYLPLSHVTDIFTLEDNEICIQFRLSDEEHAKFKNIENFGITITNTTDNEYVSLCTGNDSFSFVQFQYDGIPSNIKDNLNHQYSIVVNKNNFNPIESNENIKEYIDFLNFLYFIKPVYSLNKIQSLYLSNGYYKIQLNIDKNRLQEISNNGSLDFRCFANVEDWANNQILEGNYGIVYKRYSNNATEDFFFEIKNDYILISFSQNSLPILNELYGGPNPQNSDITPIRYKDCYPLLEFDYNYWSNSKEDQYCCINKNRWGINPVKKNLVIHFYNCEIVKGLTEGIKEKDQSIYYENSLTFLSSPYSNIFESNNLNSLILNSKTNQLELNSKYSIISGFNNFSAYDCSFTTGKNNVNKGNNNITNGSNNQITNDNSVISGQYNNITGNNNIINGYGNFCMSNNSFTIGKGNQNQTDNSLILGQYNLPNENNIFSIGNGTSNNERKNLLNITKNGELYLNDFCLFGINQNSFQIGKDIRTKASFYKILNNEFGLGYYLVDNIDFLQKDMYVMLISEATPSSTLIKIIDIKQNDENNELYQIYTSPYLELSSFGTGMNDNYLLILNGEENFGIGPYQPVKGNNIYNSFMDLSFIGIGANILSLTCVPSDNNDSINSICLGKDLLNLSSNSMLFGCGLIGGGMRDSANRSQLVLGSYNLPDFKDYFQFLGGANSSDYNEKYSFIIGNGKNNNERANALTITSQTGYVEAPQGGFVISDEDGNKYQLYVSSVSSDGIATIKGKLIPKGDYNKEQ